MLNSVEALSKFRRLASAFQMYRIRDQMAKYEIKINEIFDPDINRRKYQIELEGRLKLQSECIRIPTSRESMFRMLNSVEALSNFRGLESDVATSNLNASEFQHLVKARLEFSIR